MYLFLNKSVQICLAWDTEQRRRGLDLDASCVAVSKSGQVLLNETVYYVNLVNTNGSIRHSGDEQTGTTRGDDEIIYCHDPTERLGSVHSLNTLSLRMKQHETFAPQLFVCTRLQAKVIANAFVFFNHLPWVMITRHSFWLVATVWTAVVSTSGSCRLSKKVMRRPETLEHWFPPSSP